MRGQTKVFWTDAEKAAIIAAAVAVQAERPDLSGLPLLRAAMEVLPPERRRKLIALSQADWFEPGLKAEHERRRVRPEQGETAHTVRLVRHDDDPYAPLLREIASELRAISATLSQMAPPAD